MRNLTVRRVAFLAAVALSAACGRPVTPTAPSATTPPQRGDVITAADFPVISTPARVYDDLHRPLYPPRASRFVIYNSGAFALQLVSSRFSYDEYRGTYQETNGQVSFDFYSWPSKWSEPSAIGVLTEDSLTVRYSPTMGLSDFADGVYLSRR